MSNLTTYLEARLTLSRLLAETHVLPDHDASDAAPPECAEDRSPGSHTLGLSPDEFAEIMAEAQDNVPA